MSEKITGFNKEYSPEGICTASKKYQDIKLNELEDLKNDLTNEQFQSKKNAITDKACLCVGLVNSAYLENEIEIKGEKQGVVICPGPNLAYFDKEVSLSEMVGHIYGNGNILSETDRPNMFINELKMYVNYLQKEISNFSGDVVNSQIKKWNTFKSNLFEGINYYEELFKSSTYFTIDRNRIYTQLEHYKTKLQKIEIPKLN